MEDSDNKEYLPVQVILGASEYANIKTKGDIKVGQKGEPVAKYHCMKNHIFFFQMFRKDDLSKKIALEYDLSYIIRKDDISFPRKYDIFFTDGK